MTAYISSTEVENMWLFAMTIAKVALLTGFAPWLLLGVAIHIGRSYRVEGVFPSGFVGRCIGVIVVGHQRFVQLLITDTLRPSPKVRNKCPYPQCIREQEHGGDHEYPRIRAGNYIDVPAHAKFVEISKGA